MIRTSFSVPERYLLDKLLTQLSFEDVASVRLSRTSFSSSACLFFPADTVTRFWKCYLEGLNQVLTQCGVTGCLFFVHYCLVLVPPVVCIGYQGPEHTPPIRPNNLPCSWVVDWWPVLNTFGKVYSDGCIRGGSGAVHGQLLLCMQILPHDRSNVAYCAKNCCLMIMETGNPGGSFIMGIVLWVEGRFGGRFAPICQSILSTGKMPFSKAL